MPLTLAQAAKASGRSRSTLLRAIRKGQISASRDAAGGFLVDESELARVFPISSHDAPDDAALPSLAETLARLEAAESRIRDKDATIDDLRHRLDEERSERRQTAERLTAAHERITALLTDQRTAPPAAPVASQVAPPGPRRRWRRRHWWPWRRH